jgi:hypothetical protein
MASKPWHLHDYQFIRCLNEWKREETPSERRFWCLRGETLSSHYDGVICELTWKFQGTQLGTIQRASLYPEEAVFLALEEFERWEQLASKEKEKK